MKVYLMYQNISLKVSLLAHLLYKIRNVFSCVKEEGDKEQEKYTRFNHEMDSNYAVKMSTNIGKTYHYHHQVVVSRGWIFFVN
jgi:hypothetical protein